MRLYQIAAYAVTVIGLVLVAAYGIGYYSQSAYAYQTANNIPTKLEAGSFWLTMNPQPFLYPGVALIIIGMAMTFYHAKKSLDAHTKRQAELQS